MRYRAVVFDLDGTLVNTVPALLESFRRAAEDLGLSIDETTVIRNLGKPSPVIARILGVPEDLVPTFVERRRRYYEELWRRAELYPDTRPVLEELRRRGVRLGLVSTNPRRRLDEVLTYFRLRDYFDTTVSTDEVPRPKPAPEGLLLCLQRLGVEPREALYVGDADADILTARAAGCTSVIVLRPHVILTTEPDLKVKNLYELLEILDDERPVPEK